MRIYIATIAFFGAAALLSGQAGAKGPSFDCGKARGSVPALICQDPGLAALDRQLDAAYKAAMAKARDDMPARLRAEQVGWIRGRDECWKAQGPQNPVRLTVNWLVDTVRACVEANYKIRISELQSVWRLVPLQTVSYACSNNPANELIVSYFDTDPRTARLERGDRTVTAWLLPDKSKYEGQNVALSTHDRDVAVDWLNESLHCRQK
jgi:uncharacterized protein YecT (DUF1311 family)